MSASRLRVLALGPESWAGLGGVAQASRDYLSGLLAQPEIEAVELVARKAPNACEGGTPALRVPPEVSSSVHSGNPIGFARAALASARRLRPDLVVCLHVNLAPVAALASRFAKAPLWQFIHGFEAWAPTGPLVRYALSRADLVSASSATTRERFLSWSGFDPQRAVALECPVSLADFQPGERPRRLVERYGLEGRRVLLTLARMPGGNRSKGHDEILAVLGRLRERRPELLWLVVGDGPDRARLEERVAAAGLESAVVFAGEIPESEKHAHYLAADAFAMANRTEGLGIALLEAAATGLPVVGSTLDGSRDALLGGRLGQVVDPYDEHALLAALDRALGSERRVRAGIEGFDRATFPTRVRHTLIHPALLPDLAQNDLDHPDRAEARRAA